MTLTRQKSLQIFLYQARIPVFEGWRTNSDKTSPTLRNHGLGYRHNVLQLNITTCSEINNL